MNPMKVLGSLGELGVVLTNNKKIYNIMTLLRYNGTKEEVDVIFQVIIIAQIHFNVQFFGKFENV